MTEARYNMYRDAHKGLRLLLSELVERAGRTDYASRAELARLREEAQAAFGLLMSHAQHEHAFYGALLEQHCPGLAAAMEADHDDHESDLIDLACLLSDIDAEAPDASIRGHDFGLRLARAVAALFVHMSDEEQQVLPALWQKLSDAALQAVNARLIASIAASERPAWLRLMLRALSHPERLALLGRMREAMIPAAFEAALAAASLGLGTGSGSP